MYLFQSHSKMWTLLLDFHNWDTPACYNVYNNMKEEVFYKSNFSRYLIVVDVICYIEWICNPLQWVCFMLQIIIVFPRLRDDDEQGY